MLNQLRRHWKLHRTLMKIGFIADLEFRSNFVTRIATDIFWYIAQITTFEVLYLHTSDIGGWGLPQVRIFLGLLFVSDALYMIFLHENLDRMSTLVSRGDLDFILLKPVSSQFLVSTQKVSTALVGNLIIGSAWLLWSLAQFENLSWLKCLWLLILIPTGLLALYSLRFMIASCNVFLTRAENLQYLWWQVYKLGMKPDHMYRPWLKYTLMSLFPVSFIASVPARVVLDTTEPVLILWTFVISGFFLWLSHRLWQWALKQYSSASS